jgi:D-alanyl-D-alanine carboxypeptidase (penicillin-binding protein 5/6)
LSVSFKPLISAPIVLCAVFLILATTPVRALETSAKQAILVDNVTGAVLFEKNPDELMEPSSMSKIMTIYMIFERLADGSLKLDDTLPVSEKAWRKGGSKMFVKVGDRVSVEDLLRGIIIQSGNDATIVVAEGLAGDEETFAAEMTERARELGMVSSTFTNASGWPEEGHRVTARDLALLAKRTIENFPQYYSFYSELEFTYNEIRQGNRNPLLYKKIGADGLKTGHTQEAGYGLTASAIRDGRRLILVLNGLESAAIRSREAERLIEYGFREFSNYALFEAGETVGVADVWLGDAATVPLVVEEALVTTLTRKARRKMQVKLVYDGPIAAPIEKGARIATLTVTTPDAESLEVPLVAGEGVGKLGPLRRIGAAIGYMVWGAVSP